MIMERILKKPAPGANQGINAPRQFRDRLMLILTDRELSPRARGERGAAMITMEVCLSAGITPPVTLTPEGNN